MFDWLLKEIREQLKDELTDTEVETICVTYMGSYPAIGVHYKNGFKGKDIGELVESAANTLLRERPVIDLIASITSSGVSWKERTAEIMNTGPRSDEKPESSS